MDFASRHITLDAVISLLVLSSISTFAQTGVVSGNHVRISRSDADMWPIRGRLRAIGNDSIYVVPDGDPIDTIAFFRGEIARLEVERGERTRDQAATVLATVGALAGATAGIANCVHNRAQCDAEDQAAQQAAENDETYLDSITLLTLGGAIAGGLLGYALAPSPRWEVVVLPLRTSGLDGPSRWGLRFGVRYALGSRSR